MRKFIASLLIIGNAFAYNPNAVDYWGTEKSGVSSEKLVVSSEKKKKEEDGKKILEESKRWYEEKLKKEQPPIVYYYFKNPEKYKKYAYEWVKWLNSKGNRMIYGQLSFVRGEESQKQMIKQMKERGYRILYFYNKDCSACKAVKPEIKNLSHKIKVFFIEMHKNPDMFIKWNIQRTPTVIAVSPIEKKAYRWEGVFDEFSLIEYFYKRLKK